MPNSQKDEALPWKCYECLKMTRLITPGLALLAMLLTAPAGAGTIQVFSVSFAGDRTGLGSFAVDFGGSICVETFYDGCNPSLPWYPSTIFYNPVTAVSINIAEQHYSGFGSYAWWTAGSQLPGAAYANYDGYYDVSSDEWFYYENYPPAQREFSMYFSTADAAGGSGTWQEIIISDSVSYTASGTWTATAASVPVPAAAWLFGSGLLGLWGVVRKHKIA